MKVFGAAILLAAAASTVAFADDFSFQGSFTQDDNVQLFNFTVGTTSTVTLRTWSYAGGVNAAGVTIPEGGFDPILALFDSSGVKINENDDGHASVPADSVTGAHFDTYLQSTLDPGSYTVSVMEYNNFASGSNLSDGFDRTGDGNFTVAFGCSAGRFCDVDRASRTPNWEFDILNVNSASIPSNTAPEPASTALFGAGLVSVAVLKRKNLLGRLLKITDKISGRA